MPKDVKRKQGINPLNLITNFLSGKSNDEENSSVKTSSQELKNNIPGYKFVFIIVDWNQTRKVSGVLEEGNVAFHFINKGRGTASSEILDLLGIGANEKAVIICLCHPDSVLSLMNDVRKKLDFHSPGAGIAFAVPVSAINAPVLKMLTRVGQKTQPAQEAAQPPNRRTDGTERRSGIERRSGRDRRGSSQPFSSSGNGSGTITHDLIIAAVNQGYSDELMIAAREAGAFGGTVLSGRSQAVRGAVKFLGISVQDEKEIILILSTKEKKDPIMTAIMENRGPKSRAGGLAFSLPAQNVMGLSYE